MLIKTKEELFYYTDLLLSIVYNVKFIGKNYEGIFIGKNSQADNIILSLCREEKIGSIRFGNHEITVTNPPLSKLINRLLFNLFFFSDKINYYNKSPTLISIKVKDTISLSNEIDLVRHLIAVQGIEDDLLRELFNEVYKYVVIEE